MKHSLKYYGPSEMTSGTGYVNPSETPLWNAPDLTINTHVGVKKDTTTVALRLTVREHPEIEGRWIMNFDTDGLNCSQVYGYGDDTVTDASAREVVTKLWNSPERNPSGITLQDFDYTGADADHVGLIKKKEVVDRLVAHAM